MICCQVLPLGDGEPVIADGELMARLGHDFFFTVLLSVAKKCGHVGGSSTALNQELVA